MTEAMADMTDKTETTGRNGRNDGRYDRRGRKMAEMMADMTDKAEMTGRNGRNNGRYDRQDRNDRQKRQKWQTWQKWQVEMTDMTETVTDMTETTMETTDTTETTTEMTEGWNANGRKQPSSARIGKDTQKKANSSDPGQVDKNQHTPQSRAGGDCCHHAKPEMGKGDDHSASFFGAVSTLPHGEKCD
jgi:hypothetical protein